MYQKSDFQKLFTVPDDVFEKVVRYHALLLKWNKAINIVSPKTLDQAWHRHLIDSAQVAQYIPEEIKTYADLGCGGGFPGLVIAMMRPELDVHLVESDERKCQFMRSVVRETELSNVTVHTKRIEAATQDITPDFISARALAPLEKLFDYCYPWVEQNPKVGFCFLKGMRVQEEIFEAEKRYKFSSQSHDSITDTNSKILVIHEVIQK